MNAYRQTTDRSLDRRYLRVSAVYRCAVRYGMSARDCVLRLSERMSEREASALVSIWRQTEKLRRSPTFTA